MENEGQEKQEKQGTKRRKRNRQERRVEMDLGKRRIREGDIKKEQEEGVEKGWDREKEERKEGGRTKKGQRYWEERKIKGEGRWSDRLVQGLEKNFVLIAWHFIQKFKFNLGNPKLSGVIRSQFWLDPACSRSFTKTELV